MRRRRSKRTRRRLDAGLQAKVGLAESNFLSDGIDGFPDVGKMSENPPRFGGGKIRWIFANRWFSTLPMARACARCRR
jgi:hypothetical protein